ncbi:ribokinase [Salipiger sp. H15]|uniref:Ribokinase n=1 Tax=Alloyangia sp. H15 TaxID=3029062 RepID=A0AAU8AM20_9RHOB
MGQGKGIAILGIYVADTAYLAGRMPRIGETLQGTGFSLGPGGKGSNQAVAAGRAGAEVCFISKIGDDPFGKMALEIYAQSGVTPKVEVMSDMPSGAAFIFVNDETGENAIIVYPGAAGTISASDVEAQREVIEGAAVFVTQLEQPAEAALAALRMARAAGVTTVFNPAPANPFDPECFGLSDYFVPNESEAAAIVGFDIVSDEDARRAGEDFLSRGVRTALITLGERGVYIHSPEISRRIPAVTNAPVIDTAGAGDAFIGGFAAALAEGCGVEEAVRFGCATAGIAVTRRGTAPAMPDRAEIDALLRQGAAA